MVLRFSLLVHFYSLIIFLKMTDLKYVPSFSFFRNQEELQEDETGLLPSDNDEGPNLA